MGWLAIIGRRDRLRHAYGATQIEIVWEAAQEDEDVCCVAAPANPLRRIAPRNPAKCLAPRTLSGGVSRCELEQQQRVGVQHLRRHRGEAVLFA